MQRLTNAPAYHRATQKQKGLTLIELVLALIVIAISTTTIAKLLVTSLNFAETNRSYAEDLRAAESCYETILAVYKNQNDIPDNCPGRLDRVGHLVPWASSSGGANLFEDQSGAPICKEMASCENITIDTNNATRFSIKIKGNQNLQLIVPNQ